MMLDAGVVVLLLFSRSFLTFAFGISSVNGLLSLRLPLKKGLTSFSF